MGKRRRKMYTLEELILTLMRHPGQILSKSTSTVVRLKMFREKITATPSLMADLGTLCNRNLGCFCVPDDDCHGQILIDLVEENIHE